MSTADLDGQLDEIFEHDDRDDMAPTIAALLPLLGAHPGARPSSKTT